MQLQDDRTPEQKISHSVLIAGTDSFLSGWGKARGGTSYAAWACKPGQAEKVFKWVKSRGEMKRVRYVASNWRPSGKGHAHIYVVDEGHRALA